MIEQSFSTMNNVINQSSKTNRINVETVNAIQTVKYDLKAKNEYRATATLMFYDHLLIAGCVTAFLTLMRYTRRN